MNLDIHNPMVALLFKQQLDKISRDLECLDNIKRKQNYHEKLLEKLCRKNDISTHKHED